MEVDPLASMRCWPIELELGGRTYDVPALSAVDWWPVLVSGDLSQILDFVVSSPEDPFNLDDLLLEGKVDNGDLAQALSDAIEAAAGRSFHASFVIATVARSEWAAVNGALARRGFRWDEQPLGAALDALYATLTEHMSKDNLGKFLEVLEDESLTAPGKKRAPSERIVNEFESMAGPKPKTGVKSTGAPSDNARPKTRRRPRPPRQGVPSREPMSPREPPAGSDPGASSGSPVGAARPASGTGPRPPL